MEKGLPPEPPFFYLFITLLNHLFVILMVRVIACNSKAVSFSSICICPEKVYKPKLIFYSISQPNHLHLILYNNSYSLYIIYDVISVKTNIFLGNVQVTLILTNYHLRTNLPRLRLPELQLESVIMTMFLLLYNTLYQFFAFFFDFCRQLELNQLITHPESTYTSTANT